MLVSYRHRRMICALTQFFTSELTSWYLYILIGILERIFLLIFCQLAIIVTHFARAPNSQSLKVWLFNTKHKEIEMSLRIDYLKFKVNLSSWHCRVCNCCSPLKGSEPSNEQRKRVSPHCCFSLKKPPFSRSEISHEGSLHSTKWFC